MDRLRRKYHDLYITWKAQWCTVYLKSTRILMPRSKHHDFYTR
jgi:hypothetical protein